MSNFVLLIRFLLEISTIIGLFTGTFISEVFEYKLLFFVVSIVLTLLWARYGAPKSPHVFVGFQKLLLEIFVYTVGSIGFYQLFGIRVGTFYLVVVVIDLALMYLLGLQGH
ncbi:hypothetical protein IGI37_000827 [Enterococcus sp. AZ194]|uniref:DUF2568 domain-containing protein n=1 Tax=Enterococcus sp. AZ194 TaxID=2774629 RepID=UPI003F227EB0